MIIHTAMMMLNQATGTAAGGAGSLAMPAAESLGVFGVAGLIFWFYRKREVEISNEKERRAEDFKSIVQANTSAMVEVKDAVRELTGYMQRESRDRDRNT